MKHSTSADLGVSDFDEEDVVADMYSRWSKFSNPNSEDPAIKYQFLQYASTASVNQLKKGGTTGKHVHVVAIDDDHDVFSHDITHGSIDSWKNVTLKQSEGLDVIPDRDVVEGSVSPESACRGAGRNFTKQFRSSAENDPICSIIPEAPPNGGSVDTRTPDGHDIILENSPSTPTSLVEENYVDVEADDQPSGSLEMDDADTVVLHTDYVMYANKYFQASPILFSGSSVKVKPSPQENESGSSRLEWEIDEIASIESHWSNLTGIANVKLYLSTRCPVQEGNAQDITVFEVLEFLVHDRDWPWRQERIVSLHIRYKIVWSVGLTGKWSDEDAFNLHNSECSSYPYIPNFKESFEEVVYPEGDVDAVSISKRDVDLLEPDTFVNDTIIDFYITYLKNRIPPQEKHRYHFFNSFFFRKLADLDKNPSNAFDSKAAFQRVHKWTRKVNIFEKDYIFIPVNYNLHWSLIVICHPGEVGNFNYGSIDESLKVPCILHMDSIRGSHTGLKDLVQSYLLEEWKERQKDTSEEISSNFLNLWFLSLELPQQENCSDCGLFVLHYAELFISEAPASFNPYKINKFENFLKPDWFMPTEASLKRVHIQRLICELLEIRTLGTGTPSCHHESHPLTRPENNEDYSIKIISEKRSPGKSWNANISYSQSVQGIDLGLLDVSLYRTYIDLGMQELLEHCQHCDQGASSGQLECQNQPIREVDMHDTLVHSSWGQGKIHPVDEVASGARGIVGLSRGCNAGFAWDSESSDHAESKGNSLPALNCSSDDSQGTEIIEFDQEKYTTASLGQNQNLDHFKENVDSLTDSYSSASSNFMETPVGDSGAR